MKFIIYHNTKCQKSRTGLQYLRSNNIEPEVVEYLKDQAFTESSLKDVLKKLNLKPSDIIRTQEKEFKQNFKGKDFTDDQWIQLLVKNPKLIRRPIIVKGNNAVLGDIIKHIDTLL